MIKSFCKVNLSLRVLKKLKTGLHDIQSNTLLLDFYDVIKIYKLKKNQDVAIFKGKFKKLINRSKNSVLQALSILRINGLVRKEDRYKIVINKRIPVFAGLGGGTSNAAFLIKHFTKNKTNNSILGIFEKKIGSDLRFFFNKQTYQKNLKKFKKYKKNFTFYFVLIYPNIECSTKKIYSRVKQCSPSFKIDMSKITSKKKFIHLIRKDRNDLEKIVISEFPILKTVINFISIQEGCYLSRMTGSGSVCFGIFRSRKLAILALGRIKKKFPRYRCVLSKTV